VIRVSAFQADDAGSIPAARFLILQQGFFGEISLLQMALWDLSAAKACSLVPGCGAMSLGGSPPARLGQQKLHDSQSS